MLKLFLKRTLSVFMVIAMLSSMCVFAAEEATVLTAETMEKGKSGTFNAWCWSYPEDGCDNMYPTFYIANRTSSNRPDNPDEGLGNLAKESAIQVAQKMKKFMEKMPEGHRVIMPIMSKNMSEPKGVGIGGTFDNWFWWDEGVEIHIEAFKELFYHYKKIGGPDIDAMTLDYEIGMDVWNLEWDKIGGKTLLNKEQLEERYQAIVDDPRYETDIRPTLEAMDFEFYEGSDHNELYNYWNVVGDNNSEERRNVYLGLLWASQRKDMYLNQIFEFLRDTYYPDLKSMNYGSTPKIYNPDHPDNYHYYEKFQVEPPVEERESQYYGTANAQFYYGSMGSDFEKNPDSSYPFDTFKRTPFNGAFRMMLQYEESMAWKDGVNYESYPWVGPYTWDYNTPYASTDFWFELNFHLALNGVDTFQAFNNSSLANTWEHDDLLFSQQLHELDEVVGFEDRKPLWESITPGDQRYMLSGMYAGGKNVWRISPDLYIPEGKDGHVTMETFCTDRETPTFQIGNQFVKFPEGSFIYESDINISDFGYWVISPEGTRPEEYRDENLPIPAEPEYDYVSGQNYEIYKAKMTAGMTDEEKAGTVKETSAQKYTKKYRDEIEAGVSFPDLVGHWAEDEMRNLADKGILEGSDGLMYPDQQVTKAEFLAMVLRALDIPETELTDYFKDVTENDWFAGVMQTAFTRGYVEDTNGYMLSNKKLAREDMAVIISKILPNLVADGEISFADSDKISEAALEAVKLISGAGIINGYPDATFRPTAVCTRAETAMIIVRILALSDEERALEKIEENATEVTDGEKENPSADVTTETQEPAEEAEEEETVEEEIIEEEIIE